MLHEFYVSLRNMHALHLYDTIRRTVHAPFLLYYKPYSVFCMLSNLALPECHHATVTLSLHAGPFHASALLCQT